MATQLISLPSLNQMRQHIRRVLTLPALENVPNQAMAQENAPGTLGELVNMFQAPTASDPSREAAAPNVEGRWFVSSVNPGDALLQLKGLRVKPGWRLVPYLLRTSDGGVGHVCAVPEDNSTTTELESALPEGTEWHYPPFPQGAMTHSLMALEGDRSPASYLVASMLLREMKEFGAMGKDQQFTHHRLIDGPPPQLEWRWKGKMPQNFSPKVNVTSAGAAVEFYSCRTRKPYALFRHLDRYGADNYLPSSKDEAIAVVAD
jgi:hypothetical protein